MVHFLHHDSLLTLEILGVDVDAHRRFVAVEPSRCSHLNKFVVAFHHIADGDGAVRPSFLGGNDLPIPQDDKNSASQRAAALVHLF